MGDKGLGGVRWGGVVWVGNLGLFIEVNKGNI